MLDLSKITLPVFTERGPELAQKVAQWITDNAAPNGSLGMGDWGQKTACGTTACIAGWTMILTGRASWQGTSTRQKLMAVYENNTTPTISAVEINAAELLELDDDQSRDLFYASQWPTDIYDDDADEELRGDDLVAAMWEAFENVYGSAITIPEEYR